jgi:hypothetical protein
LGVFTASGPGSLVAVQGMKSFNQYSEVLRRAVLSTFYQLFQNEHEVFQHEFALCHTSRAIKNFTNEVQFKLRDWPGSSPNLYAI